MPAVIVFVEDEEAQATMLKDLLDGAGYIVHHAQNAFQARGLLAKDPPDLIILDRVLPDADGLELCHEIKSTEHLKEVPVLFLSAKKTAGDKVSGLKLGADDYIAKPYNHDELLIRVSNLLKRATGTDPAKILRSGRLRVDVNQIKAFLDDKPLDLWPKEFALLKLFIERKGHVFSREALLTAVWGYDKELEIASKTVDVTISRLRKKLGEEVGALIEYVRGHGYRYTEPG